jgi:AcrR family transcriptional regulator
LSLAQQPAAKRPSSKISDVRKKDLIKAAINSIAQTGYNDVTVETICVSAGFSRGLIGHYFKGKDLLLLEAVKQVAAELGAATRTAAAAAGDDPLRRLHAVIWASFNPPGFTDEHVSVWVALAGNAPWSPELALLYRDLWRDYRGAIERLLARAARAYNLKLDAAVAAMTFTQLVEGLWIGWAADPEAVARERAEAACKAYLDALFKTSGQ